MRKVAIQDANILIDCSQLGLLSLVMELPFLFQTTDLVIAEMLDGVSYDAVQECIDRKKILVKSLSADQLSTLEEMMQGLKGLSVEDCSVLQLAVTEKAVLLTSDKVLRKNAEKMGLEVHGTLWVIKELVKNSLMAPNEACEKLHLLQSTNERLPASILEELMKQWCS